jgi:hypothetical protein
MTALVRFVGVSAQIRTWHLPKTLTRQKLYRFKANLQSSTKLTRTHGRLAGGGEGTQASAPPLRIKKSKD